jgi:diaminopimelate epimerase
MKFTKMHGTGNDFVVVDGRQDEDDWPKLAVAVCDRHFGAGADGLLLVCPSDSADLRMRIFNPDGSEAEMCGNGIRCFVKYAVERGLAPLREGAMSVETLAGVVTAQATLAGSRVVAVRVALGRPRPAGVGEGEQLLKEFPLEVGGGTLAVTCVSMGNPHAVHFIEEPVADFPLEMIGPLVERHPLFPDRTNFEVARALARDRIEARVWERGAGITLACGSGAAAVAVSARMRGLVDNCVTVLLPGGPLKLEWDGASDVYLSGPAVEVFEGAWPD